MFLKNSILKALILRNNFFVVLLLLHFVIDYSLLLIFRR